MKKIFAAILTFILTMSMAVAVFAADPTYTITINNSLTGHTYEAYQIFSGELSTNDSGQDILSNIGWGESVADPSGLLSAVNAASGLSSLHGATNAAQLAEKLSVITSDSETLNLFAETISGKLTVVSGTSTGSNPYTISGLKAGYYLVKDKDGTLEGTHDVYTKFILRVVKDQEVNKKGHVPDVVKEINDTLNGTYTEVKDFDISDTAYYKWTGSLPDILAEYDTYYYEFVDTLPVGISFTQIEEIYFANKLGENIHTIYNRATDGNTIPQITGAEITLTHTDGDYVRDTNGKITSVTTPETVKLTFNNVRGLWGALLPSHDIVVKYSALVNRDALFKTDMKNQVKVIFDNNPNGSGRGETPPDEAHAFTYQIAVDKVDDSNDSKKLKGAEFVLYYRTALDDTITKHYAQVVTSKMVEDAVRINGKAVTAANIGNVYGWTTNKDEATVLVTDENGYFRVGGLDTGIFFLEETKAPAGYNLMETPVMVEISARYIEGNGTYTSNVTYSVDGIEQVSEVVKIRNSAGSTLPITGGVGTTMFYIIGAVLVTVSAVLLVSRKRMDIEK